MTHILITSSVLILGVLLVRRLLRSRLDPRVQYALWALVLARLLIPVSLPAWNFSVLTAAAPVERQVVERVNAGPVYLQRVGKADLSHIAQKTELEPGQEVQTGDSFGYAVVDKDAQTATRYALRLTVGQVLGLVWKIGMAAMGLFFLLSNLLFWRRLARCRQRWEGELPFPVRQRVYLVPEAAIPSPCLFGGAIYLTPKAAQSPATLAYVLRHESTHARHLDPLWALLRCVCLTVYWFDPLVWLAVGCAKHDCELACDQSVMAGMDREDRLGYGQALLTLVPVKRAANPFLSATTMTAGKAQLRRRIRRIAQQPRRAVAVAVVAAILAAVFCACTFTGGKSAPSDPAKAAPGTANSLTGQELTWFNEEFFGNGEFETMPTQFANPWILYDDIRDVNLRELFYVEGEPPTDEEIRQHMGMDPANLPCPAYKLTRDQMNDLLGKYTGTTLADSHLVGLEQELGQGQDAWYWEHGDTNYCGRLCFLCGTREETVSGATVRLYHSAGSFAGGQWYCVTLSEQGAGEMRDRTYHFVSNQTCDRPAIPTPLPEGKPEAVLSLEDARECMPQKVTLETRPAQDFSTHWEDRINNWELGGHHIQLNRCKDGVIRAAVEQESGAWDVFLSDLSEEAELFFYNDLFGKDGFFIYHYGQYDDHSGGPLYDYYYFDDNGQLMLLARTQAHFSEHMCLDADGDGTDELVCGRYLYFARDGKLFEADLSAMLAQEFPELGTDDDFASGYWEPWGKYCELTGNSYDPQKGGYQWTRYLYFDGESIVVYKHTPQTQDHVAEGADVGVPTPVVEAAKAYVLDRLEQDNDGIWHTVEAVSFSDPAWEAGFDDWRVAEFSVPYENTFDGTDVIGWCLSYELHALRPANIVLAGSVYVTEDGWAGGHCPWLFFQKEDEEYVFLFAMDQIASPGSKGFEEDLANRLKER